MHAYEAEFTDNNDTRCICTVAASSHEEGLKKLKRLWTVKKVLEFKRSKHLKVAKSSDDGLDIFSLT